MNEKYNETKKLYFKEVGEDETDMEDAYASGWNAGYRSCKSEILKMIDSSKIYIANPLRNGYMCDTDRLIQEIQRF